MSYHGCIPSIFQDTKIHNIKYAPAQSTALTVHTIFQVLRRLHTLRGTLGTGSQPMLHITIKKNADYDNHTYQSDTQTQNAGNRRQCKGQYTALMAHAVMLNYLRTDSTQRSRMVAQSVNFPPFKEPESSLLFSQDVKNCPCPTNEINSPKTFWDSTTHKFVTMIPMWKPKISQINLADTLFIKHSFQYYSPTHVQTFKLSLPFRSEAILKNYAQI